MPKEQSAPVHPGEALYTYLQQVWDEQGTTRGAWCRKAGLPDSTVHRWQKGHEPDLRLIRSVADALGEPIMKLLHVMGLVSDAEAAGKFVGERPPVTLADALAQDPDLREHPYKREAIQQVLDAINAVESGARKSVTRTVTAKATSRRRNA